MERNERKSCYFVNNIPLKKWSNNPIQIVFSSYNGIASDIYMQVYAVTIPRFPKQPLISLYK